MATKKQNGLVKAEVLDLTPIELNEQLLMEADDIETDRQIALYELQQAKQQETLARVERSNVEQQLKNRQAEKEVQQIEQATQVIETRTTKIKFNTAKLKKLLS